MTKSELIKLIKNKHANIMLKDATYIVDSVIDEISSALANGDRVELRGFGSFSTRKRKARVARNPKTGDKVTLGERSAIYFRAGKEMRNRLNSN